MAEAFNPDIGMDIGRTNLGNISPATMSLGSVGSGLGRAISQAFGGGSGGGEGKPTEAELTRRFLSAATDRINRVASSDLSDSEKRTRIAVTAAEAIALNPTLREGITGYINDIYGIESIPDAVKSPQQLMIDEFKNAEGNTDIVNSITFQSMNRETGEIDQNKFNNLVLDRIKWEADVNTQKADTEALQGVSQAQAKLNFFGAPEQGIKGEADKWQALFERDAAQFFGGSILAKYAVTAGGQIDTIEDANRAVMTLEQRKAEQKATLMESLRKTSLDLTDKELEKEVELLLSPYDKRIAFLKQPAELLTKISADMKVVNELLKTSGDIRGEQLNSIIDSIGEKALGITGLSNVPEVRAMIGADFATLGEFKAAFLDYVATRKETPNQTILNSSSAKSGLRYSTFTSPVTQLDPDGNPVVAPTGTLNPEQQKLYNQMTDQDRQEKVNSFTATVVGWSQMTPEIIDAALPDVDFSLRMIQEQDQKKLSSGQLKYMFSDNFFKMLGGVETNTPKNADMIYSVADSALVDQFSRNFMDLDNQLRIAGIPFGLVIKDNKVSLNVTEATLKQSPEARKLIADVGSKDPDKIMEYLSRNRFGKALIGQSAVDMVEFTQSLDNINYIIARTISLDPAQQQRFPKLVGAFKSQVAEYNNRTLKSAAEVAGAPAVAALGMPEQYRQYIPTFIEYNAILDKIASGQATPEDMSRRDVLFGELPPELSDTENPVYMKAKQDVYESTKTSGLTSEGTVPQADTGRFSPGKVIRWKDIVGGR